MKKFLSIAALLLLTALVFGEDEHRSWGTILDDEYPFAVKQEHSSWCVHAVLSMGTNHIPQETLASFYVNNYVAEGKYGKIYNCSFPYINSQTKYYCIDKAGVELGDLESYVGSSNSGFHTFKVGLVHLVSWFWYEETTKELPCVCVVLDSYNATSEAHAIYLTCVAAAYYHTEKTIWILSYIDPADGEIKTKSYVNLDNFYIIQ